MTHHLPSGFRLLRTPATEQFRYTSVAFVESGGFWDCPVNQESGQVAGFLTCCLKELQGEAKMIAGFVGGPQRNLGGIHILTSLPSLGSFTCPVFMVGLGLGLMLGNVSLASSALQSERRQTSGIEAEG